MLMLRYLFWLGNTDLSDSSVAFYSVVFHSNFLQCYSLGSSYLVGCVLRIGLYIILSLVMISFPIF